MANPMVQKAAGQVIPSSGFNDEQMRMLRVVADTVVQSHTGPAADEILASLPSDAPEWQREQVRKLVESKYTDFPESMEKLARQLKASLSEQNLGMLGLTLTLLSYRAGTLMLTGHATSFDKLDVKTRESILQSWSTSRIALLRKAFRGFSALTLWGLYNSQDSAALAMGYPIMGDPALKEEAGKGRRKESYKYEFVQVQRDLQVIDTDVCIIGSGAGGGVVAATLAKEGHRVLVVEKGTYIPCEELEGRPADAMKDMYEAEGVVVTEDGSMNILAGATFGGGTTINWSASLVPQHFVREAWAKQFDLPYFLTPDFAQSLDHVCKRMGVSTEHLSHSRGNQLLIEGSRKLGYHIDRIPQNTGGNQHSCGFCGHGCPYGEKQGGVVTWLKDAAEAGASFMQGALVDRILFADSPVPPPGAKMATEAWLKNSTPTSKRKYAVGALVRIAQTGQRAIVRASKAVVSSGGSINSPATLLRSGLKQSYIGKGLKLHPCSFVTGYFDEQINPWNGSIMTAISNVVENRDGTHFGAKLEVIASAPGVHAVTAVPWKSSAQHKAGILAYNHSFSFVVITRDRDGGQVSIDSTGRAIVDYTLSPYDAASVLEGVIAGCQIMRAAGAKRIGTVQAGVEGWERKAGASVNDAEDAAAFEAWLEKVRAAGIAPNWSGLGSAHQMGSNPMGSKPSNSAVDPRGRVWGTEKLYVADASVFPTASGVNPMLSTMGVSHSIAKFIVEDLAERPAKL